MLAACALAAVVLVGRDPALGPALRWGLRRPARVALLGLLAIAAPFELITLGERSVDSGLAAVLVAPTPIFVALLAPFLDRDEAIDRRQAVGLAVGLGGVALVVGLGSGGALAGALGVLAASASYAASSFVVKRGFRGQPASVVSLLSLGAGALWSLPAVLVAAGHDTPGARAVAALVVLSLVGTAAAFVVFYWLIAQVGAGRASLVTYGAPGFALAWGASLRGEHIGVGAIGGLVMILAGVGLASRPPRSTAVGAATLPPDRPRGRPPA